MSNYEIKKNFLTRQNSCNHILDRSLFEKLDNVLYSTTTSIDYDKDDYSDARKQKENSHN